LAEFKEIYLDYSDGKYEPRESDCLRTVPIANSVWEAYLDHKKEYEEWQRFFTELDNAREEESDGSI
jgi:hypothetical protein